MSTDDDKTLILSMDHVRSVLSIEDSIELQRRAFLALGRGRTVAAPNAWLRLPGEQRGWLKLLAGYDEDSDGLGVKVLARFPRNPPGKNLGSLLLLFHPEHGSPLAIMDSVYITAVRTAAGAALATQALALDGARSMGMVGTGVLAWYSVLAHKHLCPELESIQVYSRSEERREAFAGRVREQVGVDAVAVDSVAAATAGVDVIVSATNAPEPVLDAEHVAPGQHLNAIGIRTELTPALVARCRVIGDGREETLLDGKFSVALAAGAVSEADLGPDLGAVLDGQEAGRRNADEITMFDSSGVAIQDILCAVHVHERARAKGIGTVADLGSGAVLD
jgi:alanine dehydrogenase